MHPIRSLFALTLLAAATAPASAQVLLFADDFEQGLGNWSATGLWKALAESDPCAAPVAPFPSGGTCAYYGGDSQCTYASSSAFNALTLLQPIQIPAAAAGAVLRFASREEAECTSCGWDWRFVHASRDGGASWELLGEGNLLLAWYEKWLDLSDFRGEDVLLRFTFDVVDGFANDFHGWCIDDVRVETVPEPVPELYCTAKASLCNVQLDFTGLPSASAAEPFVLAGRALPRLQPGVLFFGQAAASTPFMGGVLCVLPPTTRTPVQDSGGPLWATPCTGSYAIDFNPLIQGGAHPALVPGAAVYAQYWFRDPAFPFGIGLTDAVRFVIAP